MPDRFAHIRACKRSGKGVFSDVQENLLPCRACVFIVSDAVPQDRCSALERRELSAADIFKRCVSAVNCARKGPVILQRERKRPRRIDCSGYRFPADRAAERTGLCLCARKHNRAGDPTSPAEPSQRPSILISGSSVMATA